MKIKKHITALATAAALSATLPAVAQQSQHMTPETMLSLARVGASALSPDGKTVVYSVGFPSIKDNKIRTELFTISSDGSARARSPRVSLAYMALAGSSRAVASATSPRRVALLRSGRWLPMVRTAVR